jgi:hypothetical protein
MSIQSAWQATFTFSSLGSPSRHRDCFLHIVFRLEREFDVGVPLDGLFPDSLFQGDPDFVRDGRASAWHAVRRHLQRRLRLSS